MRPKGSSFDVVVLGGGPAGLGAAYRLARAGREVCVLERAPVVGGLASSFEVGGLRVDHGSHRLHPTTPAPVMGTLRELLGDDLQRRPRRGRIRLAGRLVGFPPRALDLVRNLPPAFAARLARDLLASPLRRARRDTFEEVVRAGLGPTLADRFYAPYVEKLFGVPAAELAGELARRRVGTRDAGSLLRRAVRREPERGVFYYPRRGYGQISEALADAAARAGASVRTATEVVRVEPRDDELEVETGAGDVLRAASVWSTLPLPVLARVGGAPDAVRAAACRLETRPLTLVYLVLDVDRWTPFDAHYFPERDVPMVRVSEPKNYRTSADDPAGTSVLCAEVPGAVPGSAEDLGRMVVDALRRSALACPDPVHVEVRRAPHAYPVYRVGFERAFATVDAWAGSVPGLVHFGRQGLFAHDNTHHALAMAWAAADACTAGRETSAGYRGGSIDSDVWATARRSFLAHVVED